MNSINLSETEKNHRKTHHNINITQQEITAPNIRESLFFLMLIRDIRLLITGNRSELQY